MNWRIAVLIPILIIFTTGKVNATESIGILFVLDSKMINTSLDEQYHRNTMDQWVVELSEYYQESQIDIIPELKRIEFRDIIAGTSADIRDNIVDQTNGFSGTYALADEFGADFIVAVVNTFTNEGLCGRAMRNDSGNKISGITRAVSVVRRLCGAETFAHEIGHSMGMAHGNLVATCLGDSSHRTAIEMYAKGYGVADCDTNTFFPAHFGTLMIGNWLQTITGGGTHVPLFSNPNISDNRCGVQRRCGDTAVGNAVRAINKYAVIYAAHEEADAHTLEYSDNKFSECITQGYPNREVSELVEIYCTNRAINSIAGIEQLSELNSIYLQDNSLRSVRPLLQYPKGSLQYVDLSGNNYILCHELDQLEQRFPGKINRPSSCFNIGVMIAIQSILLQ